MREPERGQRGITRTLPDWVTHGVRIGLATGLPVPVVVLAAWLIPPLRSGYPLALLPLLLAGPLASGAFSGRSALGSALVAGALSGVIAAMGLAFGSQVLGIFSWGLTSAAAATPMPPLPRLALLPSWLMTWAQQDVLVLQAVLALGLGLLATLLRRPAALMFRWLPGVAQSSLAGRLGMTFGLLLALNVLVGWVGFSALEEMHLRGHQSQFQVDVLRHLAVANQAVLAEYQAVLAGTDSAPAAAIAEAELEHLVAPPPHPDIALSTTSLRTIVAPYLPVLQDAIGLHGAARGAEDNGAGLLQVAGALGSLQVLVQEGSGTFVASDDAEHHRRLVTVLGAVAFAAGFGLWRGRQTIFEAVEPIRSLTRHAARIARGDFSQRLDSRGADELRELVGVVNSMTADLDRLYTAEREGRVAAEALAEREREVAAAKEFWTNTVVHDLKAPLSMVVGYAELLDEGRLGPLAPRQQEAITELRRAVDGLQRLAAHVNDRFRLESGELSLHLEAIAPSVLLANAAEQEAIPATPSIGVDVELQLPLVYADAPLIGRVLANLVVNSRKHAGAACQVVLRARQNGEAVTFSVDDNGPGIPPALRNRVFDRFAQGPGAAGGSGLGLAFCKLVVECHGGRVWADTSPAGGARVAFTLPLAPGHQFGPVSRQPGLTAAI